MKKILEHEKYAIQRIIYQLSPSVVVAFWEALSSNFGAGKAVISDLVRNCRPEIMKHIFEVLFYAIFPKQKEILKSSIKRLIELINSQPVSQQARIEQWNKIIQVINEVAPLEQGLGLKVGIHDLFNENDISGSNQKHKPAKNKLKLPEKHQLTPKGEFLSEKIISEKEKLQTGESKNISDLSSTEMIQQYPFVKQFFSEIGIVDKAGNFINHGAKKTVKPETLESNLLNLVEAINSQTFSQEFKTEIWNKTIATIKYATKLDRELDAVVKKVYSFYKVETDGKFNVSNLFSKDKEDQHLSSGKTSAEKTTDIPKDKSEKENPFLFENNIPDDEEIQSLVINEFIHDNEPQIKRREIEFSLTEKELYFANAGLIVLHPYIKYFFKAVNILEKDGKIMEANYSKAAQALYYLATGKENVYESNLVFEKFICGIPLEVPVFKSSQLDENIKGSQRNCLKK